MCKCRKCRGKITYEPSHCGRLKCSLSVHVLSHHALCCRDFVKISLLLSICHGLCDCLFAGSKTGQYWSHSIFYTESKSRFDEVNVEC